MPAVANIPAHPKSIQLEPAEDGLLVLSMGPQHPSTHGVLRLVLEMDGETVVRIHPEIGFLHTGIEKSAESKTYHQAITLTDRIDYLCPLTNNLAFVLATEKLLALEPPARAQYLRVILNELTRLNSHLVWLGTHALDMGAVTMMLYCFREREEILRLFETVSGQRMMTSYFRVGGLALEPPLTFYDRVKKFLASFPDHIDEYETLLTKNHIWLDRTKGIAAITADDAIAWGVTGPCLRATGVPLDLRKTNPYSSYDKFEFDVPTRTEGDVYARYLVRVEEMRQSVRIATQALEGLPEGRVRAEVPHVVMPDRERMKTEMEALIYHFKIVTEGFRVPAGEVFMALESPRGVMAHYVVSDGSANPMRMHVRSPCFVNLQALPMMCEGRLIADVVACIGSIDIVLGEIDR